MLFNKIKNENLFLKLESISDILRDERDIMPSISHNYQTIFLNFFFFPNILQVLARKLMGWTSRHLSLLLTSLLLLLLQSAHKNYTRLVIALQSDRSFRKRVLVQVKQGTSPIPATSSKCFFEFVWLKYLVTATSQSNIQLV